jgi:hypothetical protein
MRALRLVLGQRGVCLGKGLQLSTLSCIRRHVLIYEPRRMLGATPIDSRWEEHDEPWRPRSAT